MRLTPRVKIFFVFFATFSLVCVVLFTLLSVKWVYEAELDKRFSYLLQNAQDFPEQEIYFEEQSIVQLEDLKYFYNWTFSHPRFDIWLNERKSKGFVDLLNEKGEPSLLLGTPQVLTSNMENTCLEIYCLQMRMPYRMLPPLMMQALLGVEDVRYLEHRGIDLKSIIRALIVDIKNMKLVQGGSTLTQQLAKNLFLTNEKSFIRKLKEMVFSIYLESNYTKEMILQAYLNEVYWGVVGGIKVRGFASASLAYHRKQPMFLSEYEVGILIALLKGPYYYHPIRHTERLRQRANFIYKKLQNLRIFSSESEGMWGDEDWKKWVSNLTQWNSDKRIYDYWQATTDKSKALDLFDKYTLMRSITANFLRFKERYDTKIFSTKILLKNLQIESQDNVYRYYSRVERSERTGIKEEKHMVGSTLKPIVYQKMMKLGLSLNEDVETGPLTLKLKSGDWTPGEAYNLPDPTISVLEALQKSRNRPLIRLAQKIGFERLEKELKGSFPGLLTPLSEYPAQLLGSIELSLEEVANIYEKFIQEQCQEDGDFENTLIYQLSDPSSSTVTRFLNDTVAGLRFFGKTGTSNGGKDNWFIFYDGTFLGVIWFGVDGPRGEETYRLGGSSSSFRIFQDFSRNRGKLFPEFRCPRS